MEPNAPSNEGMEEQPKMPAASSVSHRELPKLPPVPMTNNAAEGTQTRKLPPPPGAKPGTPSAPPPSGSQPLPPPPPALSKHSRLKRSLVCSALLLLFAGYPYYTALRLKQALKSGDTEQLARLIDFTSVTQRVDTTVLDYLTITNAPEQFPGSSGTERSSVEFLGGLVNKVATPVALQQLAVKGRLGDETGGLRYEGFQAGKFGYFFFTGPLEFLLQLKDVQLDLAYVGAGTMPVPTEFRVLAPSVEFKLAFENLRWRLKEVGLTQQGRVELFVPAPPTMAKLDGTWHSHKKEAEVAFDTDQGRPAACRLQYTNAPPYALQYLRSSPAGLEFRCDGSPEGVRIWVLRTRDGLLRLRMLAHDDSLSEFLLYRQDIRLETTELGKFWRSKQHRFLAFETAGADIIGGSFTNRAQPPVPGVIKNVVIKGRRATFSWQSGPAFGMGEVKKPLDGGGLSVAFQPGQWVDLRPCVPPWKLVVETDGLTNPARCEGKVAAEDSVENPFLAPQEVQCEDGTTVTITVPWRVGRKVFTRWTGMGSGSGSGPILKLFMDSDKKVVASYGPARVRTLTIKGTGLSSQQVCHIEVSPPDLSSNTTGTLPFQMKYDEQESVCITTPQRVSEDRFSGWQGVDSSDTNVGRVTMNADRVITALFNPPVIWSLKVNSEGLADAGPCVIRLDQADRNGKTTVRGNDTLHYLSSKTVELIALPVAGRFFVKWQGDVTSNTTNLSLFMDKDISVSALYRSPEECVLSVSGPALMGGSLLVKVEPSDTKGHKEATLPATLSFQEGTTVTLLVPPAVGGSLFTGWTGDCSAVGTKATVVVVGRKSVKAEYSAWGGSWKTDALLLGNLEFTLTGDRATGGTFNNGHGQLDNIEATETTLKGRWKDSDEQGTVTLTLFETDRFKGTWYRTLVSPSGRRSTEGQRIEGQRIKPK